jgi:hypothetical protein
VLFLENNIIRSMIEYLSKYNKSVAMPFIAHKCFIMLEKNSKEYFSNYLILQYITLYMYNMSDNILVGCKNVTHDDSC